MKQHLLIATAIFLFILMFVGSTVGHESTGELKESNGYILGLNLEQVNVGDDIPVQVEITNIANPTTGLNVEFTFFNSEAGVNKTFTANEREPGHYYVKYNFTSPGIYEVKISTQENEVPIAATFEIFSNNAGCKPGQANGCSPTASEGIPNIEYYIGGAALLLIILSLGFFGIKQKNWKVGGVLTVAILIAAIVGYSLYITLASGAASSGIVTCTTEGKCFYTAHIHAYVPITICGEDYRLPIEEGSLQKAHTHEEKNMIHWHDRLPYDKAAGKITNEEPLKLKAFFEEIGIPFSSSQIADSQNNLQCPDGSNATLKMFVNGKVNTEYENYRWRDHDVIVLEMSGRSAEEIEAELSQQPIEFPSLGRG